MSFFLFYQVLYHSPDNEFRKFVPDLPFQNPNDNRVDYLLEAVRSLRSSEIQHLGHKEGNL